MHGPGSPPRGRGKVDGPPAQVGRGRITPAQAGRSPYFLYGKKDYKDHPRIGGEKAELTAAVISAMGSPPRRRGKGYREFGIDISDRITPAQAGKSVAPRQKRSALWDHPRVGGEKYSRPSYSRISMGSPPRGRGKVVAVRIAVAVDRITPAWAGKRETTLYRADHSEDHPRVGGEKTQPWLLRCRQRGSPPRGRGKEMLWEYKDQTTGITPAWAGKSQLLVPALAAEWDHPRVGGEKLGGNEDEIQDVGSPPRGRGKGLTASASWTSTGITPAWAGKRGALAVSVTPCQDHPRVGGEKTKKIP